MTPREKQIVYETLLRHNGHSLRPDLTWEQQCEINRAIDSLRVWLILETVERGDYGPPPPPDEEFEEIKNTRDHGEEG